MKSFANKINRYLFHPVIGTIWCLHRVIPERSLYKSNRDLEITPNYLEHLITNKIEMGFHFVDIDTFVAASSKVLKKRKLINISFDDGFADVFLYAYPILKKYRIPFTLYVTTDMPDGNADLWWLQLEALANGDTEWFEQTMEQIYKSGKNIAASMHAITSSQIDTTLSKKMSITWEQLRTMVSDGLCTVGSHGVSHSAMSLLSKDNALAELNHSRDRLQEMLGVEIQHYSYPHSMFNDTTNHLVWQSGYQTAVVGYGGLTRFSKGNKFFYRDYIVQP